MICRPFFKVGLFIFSKDKIFHKFLTVYINLTSSIFCLNCQLYKVLSKSSQKAHYFSRTPGSVLLDFLSSHVLQKTLSEQQYGNGAANVFTEHSLKYLSLILLFLDCIYFRDIKSNLCVMIHRIVFVMHNGVINR